MNNVYIYNNDFLSLLNLIETLILNKIKPNNIKNEDYTPNLFEIIVNLDLKIKANVINTTISKIGKINFNIIANVFLSTENNKELIIYYFYLNSIKFKDKVIYMRNLKCVTSALKIYKYVKQETHKYKGFTRFKELENNILYAEIAPTNDILFHISKHFKNRINNEYWIIKDIKRNVYSIYNKNDFLIVKGDNFKLINNVISKNELDIEELWKDFYKIIGINERKNDRCRMNFMPKKYWKYMIEMSDEI